MPLVNIALQQQQQSASSGIQSFPQFKQPTIQSTIFDQFSRETLNPTDFAVYYAATLGSGASQSVSGSDSLFVSTGTTINTIADIRISQLSLNRTRRFGDEQINSFEIDMIWDSIDITDVETFYGIIDTQAGLSALPTTARHLGIFVDTGGVGNYILSSGNGSAQSTTDTGVAIATGPFRVNIIWDGDNTATIRLFSGTGFLTLESTHIVTSLNVGGRALLLHLYLKTLGAANKRTRWFQWTVKAT